MSGLGASNFTKIHSGGILTTTHNETAYGSHIRSAGDVTLAATGGDLNLIGSQIDGNNVALAAANNLNTLSQTENHSLQSSNKNASGGVGIQIGSDGFGFYAQGSVGKGSAHGNGTTHAESLINANDTLTLVAGNDATIKGAQLTGNTVIGAIGSNLLIQSEQDTDDYAGQQQQLGGKMVIGYGSGGSISYNQSKVNSHYQSVNEVSGIQAGSGGFNITVGGNTHLIGGVIASTADPSKNLLDTGNLTYESIHNEASYSASSIGVSAGYSAGGGFSSSPMLGVPQSGHSSSDTNSGIAQSTINVRDGNTDLSGLARNPTLDNQALNPIFDAQKVQENIELGNVAGQVGMRSAGTLAQYMANHAATPEEQAAWNDGGANKTILHGLVGAATAALGGGNALQGGLGAAASEAASGAMQQYLDDHNITDPNQRNLLMQLASTAIGGAVGGGAGTATALQGDQYNRQLHETEKDRIKQLASGDPKREADLSAAACALVHCSAEYAAGTPEYDYYSELEALGNQPRYADDRALLQQQTYTNYITMKDGGQVPVEQRLFNYSWTDKTSDAIAWFDNSYGQPITRAGGLLQAVGGGTATVSGGSLAVGGGTTCLATGVSCLAAGGGVLIAGWGLDQTQAGLGTLWNGTPTSTFGGQLIQDAFGVSPGAAELIYGALGAVGSAAASNSLALANTAADSNFNLLLKSGGVFAQDGTPLMNFNGLTNAQKGVIGEVLGGSYVDNALGNAQRIGRVPGVGQNGIDDLLKVNRPDVSYVIVEYKFGSSSLKQTADGMQMSDGWLTGMNTGNNRILGSVGRSEAASVREALDAGRVEKWIVYTDPYGKVTTGILGSDGKLIPQQASSVIGGAK